MTTPPWYVITGGPCSGKTTLLKELEAHDFYIVPEAAGDLIEEARRSGISVEALRATPEREDAFQTQIHQRKLLYEEKAPRNRPVFLDRGFPDDLAYRRTGLCPLPDSRTLETIIAVSRNRYQKVFFLEQLPAYKQDGRRTEDEATAKRISSLIFEAYRECDYDPIIVPSFLPAGILDIPSEMKQQSLEKRTAFVLNHLG